MMRRVPVFRKTPGISAPAHLRAEIEMLGFDDGSSNEKRGAKLERAF
jgi:hypothetical protein